MWEPQPPATLRASTACTGITLPYLTDLIIKQTVVNLLLIESICMFQDNVVSISKPRNVKWKTSTISLVLHEIEVLVGAVLIIGFQESE
jgi:hypothetical protein